jgi:hypothetical protein
VKLDFRDRKKSATRAAEAYLYEEQFRRQVLERAMKTAAVTYPGVFPPEAFKSRSGWNHLDAPSLRSPYAGENQRCVTTLASKMSLAQFPQSTQSFYLDIDPMVVFEIDGQPAAPSPEDRQKIRERLMKASRKVLSMMTDRNFFAAAEFVELTAIVTGGALLCQKRKRKPRVFRLDTYTLDRDSYGNLLQIIVHERIHRDALPPMIREKLDRAKKMMAVTPAPGQSTQAKEHSLYTVVQRNEETDNNLDTIGYEEWQEVDELRIDATHQTYKPGRQIPWLYVPWRMNYDERYGRSKVEELYGLHAALEAFTQMLLQSGAASARRVKIIKKGSQTDLDEFLDAPNLGAIYGDPEDIGEGEGLPYADMKFVFDIREACRMSLQKAYGVVEFTPVERRTAEEARFEVEELSATNGGTWSQHVESFQMPVVRLYLDEIIEEGLLDLGGSKDNTRKAIVPRIVTGIEALQRQQESRRRLEFYAGYKAYTDSGLPLITKKRVAAGAYATSLGLDLEDELLTEEEIAQKEQQMAMATQMEGVAPTLLGKLADRLPMPGEAGQNAQNGAASAPQQSPE